jgi:hypothetical protein
MFTFCSKLSSDVLNCLSYMENKKQIADRVAVRPMHSRAAFLFNVKGLSAGWFALGVQCDFLYARFRLPQQIFATAL